MHWLPGCGGDADIIDQALNLVSKHLNHPHLAQSNMQ